MARMSKQYIIIIVCVLAYYSVLQALCIYMAIATDTPTIIQHHRFNVIQNIGSVNHHGN